MSDLISVVIPVYNDKENLKKSLEALFKTKTENFEVIIVDDGSLDCPESVVNNFPCKFIKLSVNQGQAKARNAAVAKAKGSMILFTDSDCIVMNDWVNVISAELLRSNKEDESVMAVCGKIVSNSGFIESAHAYAGYAYVQEGSRRSMKYLNTACVAVFKKAFLEVGGFSEDLRVTEDPELALKLTGCGYRVIFEPTVSVFHEHGINDFPKFVRKHKNWGSSLGIMLERKYPQRLGNCLFLLEHPLIHVFFIVPLALLTTIKIMLYNLRYSFNVLRYGWMIFIGKIFFRWGIFLKVLHEYHK